MLITRESIPQAAGMFKGFFISSRNLGMWESAVGFFSGFLATKLV